MGQRNASQGLGSMIMFIMVMLLARYGWRQTFFIYALALPLFVVLLIAFPAQRTCGDKTPAELWEEDGVLDRLPIFRVVFYTVISCIYMLCLNTLAPSLSSFLDETGIAAGTMSGIGMIAYMAGSFLAGVAFKWFSARTGRMTVFTGMVITTAGILSIALANTFATVVFGCTLQGIGHSIFSAASIIDVSHCLRNDWKPRVISLVMVFTNLGSFLSPFLSDWMSEVFLGGESMVRRFVVATALLSVFSVFTLLYKLFPVGKRYVQRR
jgi:MFS family permease